MNSIATRVSFHLNKIFLIKVINHKRYNKYLFQVNKSYLGVQKKKIYFTKSFFLLA